MRRTLPISVLVLLGFFAFVSLSTGGSGTSLHDRTASLWPARALHTGDLGIRRPAGLGFSPSAGHFLVLADHANGPEAVDAGTLVLMNSLEEPVGSLSLPELIPDPINMTFDASAGRLLLFDTSHGRLMAIPLQPGGAPIRAAGAPYETLLTGPIAARGMTVDPATGDLYILDALARRLVRIEPDLQWSDPFVALRRARISYRHLSGLGPVDLRGIAFDPTGGHLFVMSPSRRMLYETTVRGEALASYDLASLDLRDTQAMVFAPSSDATDDSAVTNLFIADTGSDGIQTHGHIFELSLTQAALVPGAATLVPSFLVRTIDTSQFSPPSPDPSGIAYNSTSNTLLISDGEVEEMSIWAGVNFFETTLSGTLLRGSSTTAFSTEPTGVAFPPPGGKLFFCDDDARRVFQVDLGADGRLGTSDDRATSFSTTAFGSGDPEGIAYDHLQNRLYLADGVNTEIYEILPGGNGVFDGVSPAGDDQVSHFDTSSLGVRDPETVEFNSDNGNLFLADGGGDKVVETTRSGALIREIDTSSVGISHAAGLAYAPGSVDPNTKNLYIADRRVDNCSNPNENDGKVFEIAIGASSGGGGDPDGIRISSGADDAEEKAAGSMSLTSGDLELTFDGSVQQVGLRFNGVAVPQGAAIASAYIQFKADETQSEATSLLIRGQATDNAPAFTTAKGNISSRAKTSAAVAWSPPAWTVVGETGPVQRTPDIAEVIQQIVDRSGWTGGNSMVLLITGSGRRTAESFEGNNAGAPLLHIELASGTVNRAPIVSAGPDQTVFRPADVMLDGAVSDDGLPSPPSTVTTLWSVDSGPGTVTFADATAVDTTASFSTAGTYVLRLTADDSELTPGDTVTIMMKEPGLEPVIVESRVAAGSDDAEEKASLSMSLTSSDLELVFDGSIQQVGVRFNGLAIPRGASIESAYIQFKADEAQSEATSLTIQAQAADSPPGFTSTAGNISTRSRTAEAVVWAPPTWTIVGQVGPDQRTPDISALIREVVSRPGWLSGNSIVILITGSGHRTAEAFEGDAPGAPLLHVEYR